MSVLTTMDAKRKSRRVLKRVIVMVISVILALAVASPVSFARQPVKPPAAPTNLGASAASASQIDLKWTDNATNESNYAVERSTDGYTFSMLTSSLTANTVSYSDTGLSPSTTYYYRVKAINSAGGSGYTNVANATTSSGVAGAGGRVALGAFPGNQFGNPAWDGSHQALDEFETLTAKSTRYVELFHAMRDVGSGSCLTTPTASKTAYADRGYYPVITWEADNVWTPDAIIAGQADACIDAEAAKLKGWGSNIYLRPFHEMNGNWMPWGQGQNNTSPQDIINAWKHMHDRFVSAGATNVKWVFAPNVKCPTYCDTTPFSSFYPGDSYVDVLALDGYNWAGVHGDSWRSFDNIYSQSYAEIAALSADKPIMIAEYASTEQSGLDKGQWITDMRNIVKTSYPRIRAMLWFENNQDGASWRIDTSQSSIDAYKELAADSYFQPS